MPIVDDLVHLLFTSRLLLSQTDDLDLVVAILLDLKLFLVVKKVDALAAINFEEAHVESHASWRQLVHVLDGILGHSRHCECLA